MVARRPPKEAVQKLSADDRAWLEQRLREYRRLLDYLPRPLRLPTVDLAVAINEAVRELDEWFDESDDLPKATADRGVGSTRVTERDRIDRDPEPCEYLTDPRPNLLL